MHQRYVFKAGQKLTTATDPVFMTLNYSHLSDVGLLLLHWRGKLTLGDFAKAFETLNGDPAVTSVTMSLSDFSEVDSLALFHSGLDLLREVIGDETRVLLAETPHRAAFFIGDRRLLSDVLNFATMLNRIPHLHAKVFEDKAEALAWLGLPDDCLPASDPRD